MTTVLVTCGGGFQGLGMVQALRRAGDVRVLVCDVHTDNPTRYACHEYLVCPPLADTNAFKAFLLSTVEDRHIEFVFPATALDLRVLADLQPDLRGRGADAAVSPQPLLDRLLDKLAMRGFLESSNLPAEQSIDPHTHDYVFPLIGKLREGWGGRGVITLDSHTAAQTMLARLDGDAYAWARAYTSFEEYSADFAIGADKTVSPISVRRRVRTTGGFAVVSVTADSARMQELFGNLANALAHAGGCGCFNAQAIRPDDAHDAIFISDINPRLGTSATHALAEGNNLPAFFMHGAREYAFKSNRRIKTVRWLEDLALPCLQRRPRGVVFDLDDTLVDHKRWMFAKMERLYATCFAARVAEDEYKLVVAQLIEEHDWSRLIDRTLGLLALSPSLRTEAIATYRSFDIETPLFDEVEPVLESLRQAGIRLAILTDNPPTTQRAKLLRAPVLRDIDAILSRESGGEKPAIEAFRTTAKRLSLSPDDLVMVGDSWFRDGIGALRAGYAHALMVPRDSACLDSADIRMQATPAEFVGRIHALPNLISVQHVCLDAPV